MTRARGLAQCLSTPTKTVRKLRRTLYAKAKAQPAFKFYSLWDKLYREDVLAQSYSRCRRNRGNAGVDGETFEKIEAYGVEQWLAELGDRLRDKSYYPQPLRRVWIPKRNGKLRPLGIPCICDRVVQMAMTLVLLPIFESDFKQCQFAYRPKVDAKMAVRSVYFHVKQRGLNQIVDADLEDYFTTIPHGALMKCVSRRVVDRQVLKVIKDWLEMPVIELTKRGPVRSRLAKQTHRGTPQGGVISPLLANLYFRRFILAWEKYGFDQKYQARIVNYADDLVICCLPGNAEAALAVMGNIMTRLGLTVNREKTTIVQLPNESLTFLGYTLGTLYGRGGKPYIGTRPSKQAVRSVIHRIHDETAINKTWASTTDRIAVLNTVIRGWAGYFNQGPVLKQYADIQKYTERRLRRWLVKKHKQRGKSGFRLYSDEYLYETLGLYKLPRSKAELLSAKAY